MKKAISAIIVVIALIAGAVIILQPSSNTQQMMTGSLNMTITDLNTGTQLAGQISIAQPTPEEQFAMDFGQSIRSTTMQPLDTVQNVANIFGTDDYAITGAATIGLTAVGIKSLTSSTVDFMGIFSTPMTGVILTSSTYSNAASYVSFANKLVLGSNVTVTQATGVGSDFRYAYNQGQTGAATPLLGTQLNGLKFSVQVVVTGSDYSGNAITQTGTATVDITVTSWQYAQIVVSISSISIGTPTPVTSYIPSPSMIAPAMIIPINDAMVNLESLRP